MQDANRDQLPSSHHAHPLRPRKAACLIDYQTASHTMRSKSWGAVGTSTVESHQGCDDDSCSNPDG
eukprot:8617450-Heterocapsa_arctica.AAC.1